MPKILLVDDKPDNLVALHAQLRVGTPDCEILTAASGQEGIEQARSAAPDLILLDVHMPEMDGYTVLRRLKRDPTTRVIPVALITAVRTEAVDLVRGLETGAEAYLTKPIDPNVLTAQVRTLLRMKRAEDQLRDRQAWLEEQVRARTAKLTETNARLEREVAGHQQARAELSKAIEQWELTFNTTEDAIFLADADMKLCCNNLAFAKLVGRPREELIGRPCCQMVHDTEKPPSECPFLRARESRRREFQDWLLNDRWYHTRVDLVLDEQGEIRGYTHIMTDITERKQAEQALADRTRQQAEVAELGQRALAHPDLQSLFDLTVEKVAVALDVEFCKVLERLPEADELKLVAGVGWQAGLVGHAIIGAGKDSQAGYTLQTNEPVVVEDLSSETRFSGPPLLRAHHVVSGLSVIIPGPDQPFGVLGAHTTHRRPFTQEDVHFVVAVANVLASAITRQRAESELRASEEKFRGIIEHSTNLHYIHTPEHVLTYVSPQAEHFLGCSPAAAERHSTRQFVTDNPANRHGLEATQRAIDTGEPQPSYELELLTKDGRKLWVEVHESPVVKDGRTVAIVGALLDITERKRLRAEQRQLEAHLRHQEKLDAIGTLAAGVAHEINNPISGIMGYADIIREEAAEGSQTREFAGEIIHETERVATIVKNLLTFARQEKPEHVPTPVGEIVKNTLSLIGTIVKRDRIHLETELPPELPIISCQSQQLQQVLMNLMTNARDALNAKYPEHHPGKLLRVAAVPFEEAGAPWVRLTIEDRGTGIPPEVVERMYEPFFTTKPRGQGTGLGMSISLSIVQEHHGRLRLETEPGQYTRFHIELPAEVPTKSTAEPIP